MWRPLTFSSLILSSLLGLVLSFALVFADWSAPSFNPPSCPASEPGCNVPLNVGTTPQIKSGALVVNTAGQSTGLIIAGGQTILNGNVGIGTTGPNALLEIAQARAVDAAGLRLSETSGTGAAGDFLSIDFYQRSLTPNTQLSGRIGGVITDPGGFNGGLAFYTSQGGATAERVRITSAGNVGIGTTNPTQKLDVNGNIAANGGKGILYFQDGEGEVLRLSGNNGVNMHIENINGTLRLVNHPWSADVFHVDQSGNTYIGGNLQIAGGARASGDVCTDLVGGKCLSTVGGGGGSFWGANGSNIYNTNSGNLGIGTTGPQRKLDVAGRLLVREGSFPNGWDVADWGATVSFRQPGAVNMGAASAGNAQLEIVSTGRNTPHIAFHAPGFYGANFGLDTDDWLSTQGWSAGGGYTGLRGGPFRAVGSATIDGNLTVSGQSVCRQDGTNCPTPGGGGGAPAKIGAVWKESNSFATFCPSFYFSGPNCTGSSYRTASIERWLLDVWSNPQSILITPTFTYQSAQFPNYNWWQGCFLSSCVNTTGTINTDGGSCASGWKRKGFQLEEMQGGAIYFYMCVQ